LEKRLNSHEIAGMPSSFDKDQFIDEIEENSNDDKSEDENYNCLVANDEDY